MYLDPNASIDDRIEDLLSRMTVEEKVWQLQQGTIANIIDSNYNLNTTGLPQYGSMFGKKLSSVHFSRDVRRGFCMDINKTF